MAKKLQYSMPRPDAKPSTPSMRLKALMIAANTKKESTYDHTSGSTSMPRKPCRWVNRMSANDMSATPAISSHSNLGRGGRIKISSTNPTIMMANTPISRNWDCCRVLNSKIRYVSRNEKQISSPPILGTSPVWLMRLLGRTTKCLVLATRSTTGINSAPKANAIRPIK